MVKTTTELDTQHIYTLDVSDDLPLGLIPLVVDHKIDHKYPKSASILILSTKYYRIYIPSAAVTGMLNLVEIESNEVRYISWTKTEKPQDIIRNSSTELQTYHHVKLPTRSS